MKSRYITKPDNCGNVYRLEIDHEKKTYTENCFFTRSEAETTTRKRQREILTDAKQAGYTERQF